MGEAGTGEGRRLGIHSVGQERLAGDGGANSSRDKEVGQRTDLDPDTAALTPKASQVPKTTRRAHLPAQESAPLFIGKQHSFDKVNRSLKALKVES